MHSNRRDFDYNFTKIKLYSDIGCTNEWPWYNGRYRIAGGYIIYE